MRLRDMLFGRRADVVISYRREEFQLAEVLNGALGKRGYRVFMDRRNITAGTQFDERIEQAIAEAKDVVVVLTRGALDRCRREGDWMHREIRYALALHRHVVPVTDERFEFPPEKHVPEDIRPLLSLQAVPFSRQFVDAAVDKLVAALHARPRRGWALIVAGSIALGVAAVLYVWSGTGIRTPDGGPLATTPTTIQEPAAAAISITRIVPDDVIEGQLSSTPAGGVERWKVLVYVRVDRWHIHPYATGGEGQSWARITPALEWRIATVRREFAAERVAAVLVPMDYDAPAQVESLAAIPAASRVEEPGGGRL